MKVLTQSEHGFETLRRIVASSVGYPGGFAVPVDAQDEPETLTIIFDMAGNKSGTLEVVAEDRALTLRCRRNRCNRCKRFEKYETHAGARVCRLPCAVDTTTVATFRRGDKVIVRLRKKGEALDLPRKVLGSVGADCAATL